jgi:hypothetical protein
MHYSRFLLLGPCVLLLSACQAWEGIKQDMVDLDLTMPSLTSTETPAEELVLNNNCPHSEVVSELGAINEFSNPAAPTPENLVIRATISGLKSACTFGEKSMTVDIKVAFEAALGPQAATRSAAHIYPFFVAVIAPNGDILAKEIFTAPLTFSGNQGSYFESLRQIIPVYNPEQGPRYKVLVGFQLTQEQLAYNRFVIAEQKKAAEATAKAAEEAAKAAKNAPAHPSAAPTAAPAGAPMVLVP